MRTRLAWLLSLTLLIPATVHADDHRADFFGGASYADGSRLFGFHTAFTFTSPQPASEDLAFTSDISIHFNDQTRASYMFGPRWAFASPDRPRFVTSVQVLLGGVYTSAGPDQGNRFAWGAGVIFDYLPGRQRDRAQADWGWGFRTQVDYFARHGAEPSLRVSTGAFYRFDKE